MSTKFLIFDGVDSVGKSTFINAINRHPMTIDKVKELKFPKLLPSGTLMRINDEKSFELLFTMFEHLDPSYVYILDRFITSNLVYDKVLRNENIDTSLYYWDQFNIRFDVKQVILTRPEISHDFVDDKIKMSREAFNGCIAEYEKYGTNYMLIQRDDKDNIIGFNKAIDDLVTIEILDFIFDGSVPEQI